MGGKPKPALKAVWRISHGIHNAQQRNPDAHHGPRDFQLTPDKAEKSLEVALERLGLAYADLMILHQPARDYLSGYRQLEKAYKEGKLRAIGLSNFSIECWFPNLLQPIASKLHLVREIPGHEKILSFRARKRKDFSMIPKKFKHLDFDDRKTISNCISQGLTEAETARRIGVSPSTVGREVERHAHYTTASRLPCPASGGGRAPATAATGTTGRDAPWAR